MSEKITKIDAAHDERPSRFHETEPYDLKKGAAPGVNIVHNPLQVSLMLTRLRLTGRDRFGNELTSDCSVKPQKKS